MKCLPVGSVINPGSEQFPTLTILWPHPQIWSPEPSPPQAGSEKGPTEPLLECRGPISIWISPMTLHLPQKPAVCSASRQWLSPFMAIWDGNKAFVSVVLKPEFPGEPQMVFSY